MLNRWFFVFLHMIARTTLISFLLLCYVAIGQEGSLPADLRQHTLTQYNASLFNPAFSLDRNNPESVSYWSRWQSQNIDTDPTTLFLNYSRKIDDKSGFTAGFFQHNTGIFFNTGGVVNYAYEIKLNPIIKLSVGANLFGFKQELADTRFLPDPDVFPVPLDVSNDFILQLAPGFNLSVENFSLSMASENLFDYNVSDKEANTATSDKIYMGMVSYDLPVMASDSTAYLRPSIYLRTIPEQENQIGFNTLFSTRKYWAQAGYNNFYGISIGGGGTVFNRVSLGALVEFRTNNSFSASSPSYEIIASYFLGKPQNRRQAVVNIFDALEEEVVLLNEEEKTEKIKEELENAQKIASEQNNTEEKQEEEKEEVSDAVPMDEDEIAPRPEGLQINKKEAKRLAAQERALAKELAKDSLNQIKRDKEALALAEKEKQLQEKKAKEEAKIAEAAIQNKKEEEAVAAAEEAKRIAALNEQQKAQEAAEELKKAEALAFAEKEKQLQEKKAEQDAKVAEAAAQKKKEEEAIAAAEEAKRITALNEQKKAQEAAEELRKAEAERAKVQKQKDSLVNVKKMEAIVASEKIKAQKKADSIAAVKSAVALAEAEKLKIQQRQDSIQKSKEALANEEEARDVQIAEVEEVEEKVIPEAGEKYEEVAKEDGLEPGFYLIANVFGTKKYFDAFMQDLRKKGIEPGAFLRSKNNYNYAYLKRYNSIGEARRARDSKFEGKYQGKTWIFRVVGE